MPCIINKIKVNQGQFRSNLGMQCTRQKGWNGERARVQPCTVNWTLGIDEWSEVILLAATEPILYLNVWYVLHQMSAAESYLVGTKCSPFAWCHCHGFLKSSVSWSRRQSLEFASTLNTKSFYVNKPRADVKNHCKHSKWKDLWLPSCWDCRTVLVHV